jgi:hypothetical protein
MISLNDIDSAISSVAIKSEAGQELSIDGSGYLTVNGNGTFTVSSTDFDIRDLAFATDKVDVSGSSVTATATDFDIRDLVFATDKVDVSGSSVTVSATDLDIRDLAFATDSVTAHQGGSWAVTVGAVSSWKNTNETVGLAAAELASTPLASRDKIEIQNLSSKDIYIGFNNSVTTANGLKIPKGSSYTESLGDGVDIWAIGEAAGLDVRIAEYAA